ncbi:MAG: M48 family metalloprotease [Kofleriaceae bacterium]|nr:M48 family metalloprotease [Kofleriaceae bacterium]
MPLTLAFRAGLALVLMAIYFALAAGVIVGLCWVGQWFLRVLAAGHGSIWFLALAIGSFIAAGVILWSTFPRFDKFEPPGPEVTAEEQPALFAEIARICALTGEQLPRHVYLMFAMNAFVAQRGGIMGFGSQRVMGVGLPLMRVLQVSELRAVLAHEMGHFAAGDTRLSPWIYKTRNAIARTEINLVRVARKAAEVATLIYWLFRIVIAPFKWFGIAFMRITQSISRAQELSADRLAARIAGPEQLVEGFKKTHGGSLAHQLFLSTELSPLVEDGRLPPVGEGFSKFLETPLAAKMLEDVVAGALEDTDHDPYDSHPPLRERVEALESVDWEAIEIDPRPAIVLVENAEAIEHRLVAASIAREVTPITWEEVGQWWIARWRMTAERVARSAGALTVATIPSAPHQLRRLCEAIEGTDTASKIPNERLTEWAQPVLGTALCVAMMNAGFTLETGIGEPVHARRDGLTLEPFVDMSRYLAGELSADDWRKLWADVGLADYRLGS